MKIIDAHLHFGDAPYFNQIAVAAGHENNIEHLKAAYRSLNIVHGVVMGNDSLALQDHIYAPVLSYMIGLDSTVCQKVGWRNHLALIEQHLQRDVCVGIKLYPGYNHFYIYEDSFRPLYELAVKYNKPVAVHTGLTATSNALLKYSHPLVMDEAAVKFPMVRFVMCHLGEPWFTDAIAVLEKNSNVAADLSGMLEGKISDMESFFTRKRWYMEQLKGWLQYLDLYDRLMFGTDWPLANLGDYIEFTKYIIPSEAWEDVFYNNARRIYNLSEV